MVVDTQKQVVLADVADACAELLVADLLLVRQPLAVRQPSLRHEILWYLLLDVLWSVCKELYALEVALELHFNYKSVLFLVILVASFVRIIIKTTPIEPVHIDKNRLTKLINKLILFLAVDFVDLNFALRAKPQKGLSEEKVHEYVFDVQA